MRFGGLRCVWIVPWNIGFFVDVCEELNDILGELVGIGGLLFLVHLLHRRRRECISGGFYQSAGGYCNLDFIIKGSVEG